MPTMPALAAWLSTSIATIATAYAEQLAREAARERLDHSQHRSLDVLSAERRAVAAGLVVDGHRHSRLRPAGPSARPPTCRRTRAAPRPRPRRPCGAAPPCPTRTSGARLAAASMPVIGDHGDRGIPNSRSGQVGTVAEVDVVRDRRRVERRGDARARRSSARATCRRSPARSCAGRAEPCRGSCSARPANSTSSAIARSSPVVAEAGPERAQVVADRQRADRDQDQEVEQDRPARDEAEQLVERVAAPSRPSPPRSGCSVMPSK